jgi:hypothetical protein
MSTYGLSDDATDAAVAIMPEPEGAAAVRAQRCAENAALVPRAHAAFEACARAHVTAQRQGREPLDVEEVVVFDVRDGRLARAVRIPSDQQRWDEFFMRD